VGEFEAHVRCVFPWLLVTDFEFVFVFFILFALGYLLVEPNANQIHSESQRSNTNI